MRVMNKKKYCSSSMIHRETFVCEVAGVAGRPTMRPVLYRDSCPSESMAGQDTLQRPEAQE